MSSDAKNPSPRTSVVVAHAPTRFLTLALNLFYPVEVRLASYLLSMTPNDQTLGSTVDQLTDIADLIGTSYRHVNRTLRRFVEAGLIERNRRVITLVDREGLLEIVGESIYE